MTSPRLPVKKKTISTAIANSIDECKALMSTNLDGSRKLQLQDDVSTAIRNLEWIRGELDGTCPPRQIGTQAFAAYVIDEESRMEMPKDLRDYIAEIEFVYVERVWKKPS